MLKQVRKKKKRQIGTCLLNLLFFCVCLRELSSKNLCVIRKSVGVITWNIHDIGKDKKN